MIVGSTKEDLSLEKRVSITPETAKNIINLGLKICIENDYATHLGIKDSEYKDIGVEIKNSSSEVFNISKLLLKVNCPSIEEISNLKDKTILIGMLNPSKNQSKLKDILYKYIPENLHKDLYYTLLESYLSYRITVWGGIGNKKLNKLFIA